MSRFIYRMCLAVILVIAVGGGIFYYKTFYRQEPHPDKSIFVNREVTAPQRGKQQEPGYSPAGIAAEQADLSDAIWEA